MTSLCLTAAECAARVRRIRQQVVESAAASGRNGHNVTIVAVTKFADRDAVEAAYDAGLRHFGENRVQDAIRKFERPLPADAILHMIGQLQSNKVRYAVSRFDVIESVDRSSLVAALERQAAARDLTLPVLLQVNMADESQKAGCPLSDAPRLALMIQSCPHLNLCGLMTIAPLVVDAEQTRPVFRGLRLLQEELGATIAGLSLPILSMGMTNDFSVAVEEGATHIRIGRAIFGETSD